MIGLVLAAALAAGAAEPAFDRDCMDDYARNLCDAEMRATIRAKFGVPSAERLAADGVEGVRVFLIDGYSQDMPLVTVLKAKDGAPVLEVRAAGKTPRVISKPARSWEWRVAGTLSDLAVTSPEKPVVVDEGKSGEFVMCLHAWVTVTEAIAGGKVTTRIRNACGDEPIFDGGYQMSTMALNSFDGCGQLDPTDYRNDSVRLIGCTKLAGENRSADAHLLNSINDSPLGAYSPDEAAGADWLADEVVLSWPGRKTLKGREAVAAALADQALGRRNVWIEKVASGDRGDAVVEGSVTMDLSEDKRIAASFVQEWANDKGVWRLTRWVVEPFSPPEP